VRVSGTGPGIPPAGRDRVFERFSRGDGARSRPGGGAGLGLPIARALARAHRGDLRYAEEPDRPGACFELTLPASAPAPGGVAAAESLIRPHVAPSR